MKFKFIEPFVVYAIKWFFATYLVSFTSISINVVARVINRTRLLFSSKISLSINLIKTQTTDVIFFWLIKKIQRNEFYDKIWIIFIPKFEIIIK